MPSEPKPSSALKRILKPTSPSWPRYEDQVHTSCVIQTYMLGQNCTGGCEQWRSSATIRWTCAFDWVTFHISFSLFVNLEQFYILPGALNLSSTQCAEITGGSPSIQQNAFTFYSNQTEPNLIHIIFHLLPSHPRPSPCLPPCPPPCRPPCPPPSPPTPPPPTGPLPIHLTGSLNFTLPQSSSLSSMSSSLTAPY